MPVVVRGTLIMSRFPTLLSMAVSWGPLLHAVTAFHVSWIFYCLWDSFQLTLFIKVDNTTPQETHEMGKRFVDKRAIKRPWYSTPLRVTTTFVAKYATYRCRSPIWFTLRSISQDTIANSFVFSLFDGSVRVELNWDCLLPLFSFSQLACLAHIDIDVSWALPASDHIPNKIAVVLRIVDGDSEITAAIEVFYWEGDQMLSLHLVSICL